MQLLHAFQSVERVIYAPDLVRKENDVEHSYMLVMLCWYFLDVFKLDLDKCKILEYALVHDFIEVYAGDTFIFDTEGQKSKHEREEQARLRLADEFPEFKDMHARIEEYEKRKDPEAVFVHEVDKFIPLVTGYIQKGSMWKKLDMKPDELFANKRARITVNTEIRDLLEQFIQELESRPSDFFNQK